MAKLRLKTFSNICSTLQLINDAKVFGKNVELHSVVISIDTKMFFFLLERARKVLQKNIFSRSNIAHLAI